MINYNFLTCLVINKTNFQMTLFSDPSDLNHFCIFPVNRGHDPRNDVK